MHQWSGNDDRRSDGERIHFFRGNGRKPCVMTQPPHSFVQRGLCHSLHIKVHLPFLFAVQTVAIVSHETFGVADSVSSRFRQTQLSSRSLPIRIFSQFFFTYYLLQQYLFSLSHYSPFLYFSLGFGSAIGLRGVIIITEFMILYVVCMYMSFDFLWEGRCISACAWKSIRCFVGQIILVNPIEREFRNIIARLNYLLIFIFLFCRRANEPRLYRECKKKVRF